MDIIEIYYICKLLTIYNFIESNIPYYHSMLYMVLVNTKYIYAN